MKSPATRILIAIAGLVAIAVGASAVWKGVGEMTGSGLPTPKQAVAAARAAAEELTDFPLPDHGVTIAYPKSWACESPASGPIVFKFKTWSGVVNFSLAVEDLPQDTSLDAYVERNLEGLRQLAEQGAPKVELLDRNPTTMGGHPGTRLRSAFAATDDNPALEITQIYTVTSNRGYAITLTAPTDLSSPFADLLQQIGARLRFD